jgi:hypothetical protein
MRVCSGASLKPVPSVCVPWFVYCAQKVAAWVFSLVVLCAAVTCMCTQTSGSAAEGELSWGTLLVSSPALLAPARSASGHVLLGYALTGFPRKSQESNGHTNLWPTPHDPSPASMPSMHVPARCIFNHVAVSVPSTAPKLGTPVPAPAASKSDILGLESPTAAAAKQPPPGGMCGCLSIQYYQPVRT